MHTTQLNGTPTPVADTPPAEKQPAAGRGANGRFAKGNLGGPGNPFARQIAGFRKALCAAVTEQDITELAQLLLAKAKAGDVPAMKLLFQYTLGKPAEATDPDSLDAQEMRLFQQNDVESDTMTELTRGTPAELAVKVLRVLLPTRAQQIAGAMGQMLRDQAEATAEPPPSAEPEVRSEEREARPRGLAKLLLAGRMKKCRRRRRGAEMAAAGCRTASVDETCGRCADEKPCNRCRDADEIRQKRGQRADDKR